MRGKEARRLAEPPGKRGDKLVFVHGEATTESVFLNPITGIAQGSMDGFAALEASTWNLARLLCDQERLTEALPHCERLATISGADRAEAKICRLMNARRTQGWHHREAISFETCPPEPLAL